jgi:hypothetical protein
MFGRHVFVQAGSEQRITQALREWHEKNTFKKVGAVPSTKRIINFLAHCSALLLMPCLRVAQTRSSLPCSTKTRRGSRLIVPSHAVLCRMVRGLTMSHKVCIHMLYAKTLASLCPFGAREFSLPMRHVRCDVFLCQPSSYSNFTQSVESCRCRSQISLIHSWRAKGCYHATRALTFVHRVFWPPYKLRMRVTVVCCMASCVIIIIMIVVAIKGIVAIIVISPALSIVAMQMAEDS